MKILILINFIQIVIMHNIENDMNKIINKFYKRGLTNKIKHVILPVNKKVEVVKCLI